MKLDFVQRVGREAQSRSGGAVRVREIGHAKHAEGTEMVVTFALGYIAKAEGKGIILLSSSGWKACMKKAPLSHKSYTSNRMRQRLGKLMLVKASTKCFIVDSALNRTFA